MNAASQDVTTEHGAIHRSIAGVFRSVAQMAPERIAIECAEQRMTYGELDARSDAIAAGLVRRGVVRGSIVGLYVSRSADAVAAMIGVLKAGAAYLSFDVSYPARLLRYVYEDSAPHLMLVQEPASAPTGEAPFWTGESLAISACLHEAPIPLPLATADDLAYVMYTSGSTGRPKGVLVPHSGVLRLVLDNSYAQLDAGEVMLQISPLSFDASVFEIWGALLNGGKLAILPSAINSLEEIATAIRVHGVTTLLFTAGIFNLMVDHQLEALKPLRQMLSGGDVLSPPHVAKAVRALPGTRVINAYGPTENAVISCCYTIPADFSPADTVPIGKAIAGTEALVLDDLGRPAGVDEEGELYVGGNGLAHGYLNRPDLTEERFVAHPFDLSPGARLYRTGDRVRVGSDGNLRFVGRVDRQVKINGKRIELDEIEACLRRSPLVRDAAVISYELAGQRRIAAWFTAADGVGNPVEGLRAFLSQELADFMQPSSLLLLDTLPLTPAGKIDRARLAPPAAPARSSAPMASSGNGIETALLRIWREALGIDAIGREDNFFDLGGTSLQMIRVHAAIQASLKPEAKLVDCYAYPSIGALAAWIAGAAAAKPASGSSDAQERARRQRAALQRARPPGR